MVEAVLANMEGVATATYSGPPPILLPAGNRYTADQVRALQAGFEDAWNRVTNPDCSGLRTPPSEVFALGGGTWYLQQTLADTTYRIVPFPMRGSTGAQTVDTNNVMINLAGAFFTATPDGNGLVTFRIPNPTTPNQTSTFTLGVADFRAFVLLHELGHQAGVFGADTGDPAANGQHSLNVLRDCFGVAVP